VASGLGAWALGGHAGAVAPIGLRVAAHVGPDPCGVGDAPSQPAYDPVNHLLYVPNQRSHNITVLQSTCKPIASIVIPNQPDLYDAAFDPVNNYVYVTDLNNNAVDVISGTTLRATISSPSFDAPMGIVYDPGDQVLAVTNYQGNNVTFVAGFSAISSLAVGSNPRGIDYDPFFGTLLVANYGSHNVSIINAIYLTKVRDVGAGFEPIAVAFDYNDSLDYVANIGAGNLTVMTGDGGVVGSVKLGTGPSTAPSDVAWSQKALAIYVPCYPLKKVFVVQGLKVVRSDSTPAGSVPIGVAYSDFNGKVYVTDQVLNVTYVFS
jgi:DNA-binding beta-propeller fold protein YncE